MMGEFQISNLPLIIIAIVLISIGVLGYFEIKKLYIKLNSIVTKIDEINEILPKNQSGIPRPPPHIIEQQRMMMQRQQQQQMHKMQQMNKIPEELNMPQDTNDNSDKDLEDDINHDEYSDDYSSTDDDIRSSEDKDDEENPIDVESKKSSVLEDITNLSDNSHNSHHNSHTSEMIIELDNEFKHLSIKELKDLCKEKDLAVSGNKSTLISRLLEKTN